MKPDWSECLFTWADNEPVPQGDVFFETFTRAFPRKILFRMEMVRYSKWAELGFYDRDFKLYEDF